jgi:predicted transcriptional regulator of viral defense system
MRLGQKPNLIVLKERVMARTVALPVALRRRAADVLRPRDAKGVYAHPGPEFARMTESGVLTKLATGYYAITPLTRAGDRRWRPAADAVALGIARVDYGNQHVALMGITAARHHGAVPRALAVAVVAAPKQRPPLETAAGRVIFVMRDVARLDVERIDTELGTGWVTTVEQTLLDIAARPALGGLGPTDVDEALRLLIRSADVDLLERLAREQRRMAVLKRLELHAAPR